MTEKDILDEARRIIRARKLRRGAALKSPKDSETHLQLALAGYDREVFACLWLDNRHKVIAFEEHSHGTIDGANVHPREIVKDALRHNAAAVVLAHNHPSGVREPSRADKAITKRLQEALALVDVRVIDHIVVGDETFSFAREGEL